MSDPFWVEVPRDVVVVRGPGAGGYLHSQLAQEVRTLEIGEARWSLLLAPTGRLDALVRVLRTDDDTYVLDTDAGQGEAVLARLRRFKIRVEADLDVLPWRLLAVRGAVVAAQPGASALEAWGGRGPAWAQGTDLLGPDPQPPPGIAEGSAALLEAARVEAGWPAWGSELSPETVPAETGLLDVAVSFTKGCYPGQELVERMDSRGALAPHRLVRLRRAEGDPLTGPAELVGGDEVTADAVPAGTVTTAAGDVALARVRRSVDATAPLAVRGMPLRLEEVGR